MAVAPRHAGIVFNTRLAILVAAGMSLFVPSGLSIVVCETGVVVIVKLCDCQAGDVSVLVPGQTVRAYGRCMSPVVECVEDLRPATPHGT